MWYNEGMTKTNTTIDTNPTGTQCAAVNYATRTPCQTTATRRYQGEDFCVQHERIAATGFSRKFADEHPRS
jgi:hypothetical protein